jgi:hypothetical protein
MVDTPKKSPQGYLFDLILYGVDCVQEPYYDRKTIHNLIYFTLIELQGRALQKLNAQWYDHYQSLQSAFAQSERIDQLIAEFNTGVGIV